MPHETNVQRSMIDRKTLPLQFPTHLHTPEFWEALGRTIGTFGFLEDTLKRAIFAHSGTRTIPEEQVEAEVRRWEQQLEKTLTDPLGSLIPAYERAVRENSAAIITNLDDLVEALWRAFRVRNILGHGAWKAPDKLGRSVPRFFVKPGKDKETMVCETLIDVAFLGQVQTRVVGLICAVVDTVTSTGSQFPGSNGPGKPIW